MIPSAARDEKTPLVETAAKDIETSLTDKSEKDLRDEANTGTLTSAFLLMLFFQLGNRLFYKLATYPMYNYPLYLNLMSTLVYIPICFA